ncbi:MAG: hypothetical protein IMW89_09560 [Ktedonobacteraceae bacterium]|nr:hypothetical protein [Ktedonobacteraceae bacterium]
MKAKDTNQEPELYRGYGPQELPPPYTLDEMPQSSYPHPPSSTSWPPSPTEPYQQQSQQQMPYPSQQQQQQQYYQPPQEEIYGQRYGHVVGGDVGPDERSGMGMKARTAGWLCYLLGWPTGLFFFLLERENLFVRFHAMQSILLFGIVSILETVFSLLPGDVGEPVGLGAFIAWIFLMVQASKGRYYKLPLIGDLAERLAKQLR